MTIERILQSLPFDQSGTWSFREIGNGNINYIYLAQKGNRTVIVKYAEPYARIDPVGFPLSVDRIEFEHAAYEIYGEIVPEYIPKIWGAGKGWLAMEYLTPHRVLREAILAGEMPPHVGAHLGSFLGKVCTRTSQPDFALRLKQFNANCEMRKIIEDLDYTDPFCVSERNRGLRPEHDAYFNDAELRAIAAKLRQDLIEKHEVFIHGDLHTGSVMVTGEETRVIDPEFALYGPIAFDPSRVIANFLMTYFAADARGLDRNYLLQQIDAFWTAFVGQFPAAPQYGQEILQHAGVEIYRRTLGIAGVADFRTLENRATRAAVEQRALQLARQMMVRPKALSINALTRTLEGSVYASV